MSYLEFAAVKTNKLESLSITRNLDFIWMIDSLKIVQNAQM